MHVCCAQSREALLLVLSSRQARKGGARHSGVGQPEVRAERVGSAGQVLVQMGRRKQTNSAGDGRMQRTVHGSIARCG